MFDSHCHLNFQDFENTFEKEVLDAKSLGIQFILIPGTNLENSKKAITLSECFQNLFAAVGIHPSEDLEKLNHKKTLYQISELAENRKVKAIGEIGLDYYRFKSSPAIQKYFFLTQVKLAFKNDKSIIIHNRYAKDDIIKILSENWQKTLEERIVFHCCEADLDILNFAVSHKIFIGVDGDITFDDTKKDFVKKIPIENLVIETDSPFLTPEPLRSEKIFPNTPKNLVYICQKVAELKKIPFDLVASKTLSNSKKLFDI